MLEFDELRLVAALAHTVPDGDLELLGPVQRSAQQRWVVSYRRPDADLDPCSFRQLVLAAMRGSLWPSMSTRPLSSAR